MKILVSGYNNDNSSDTIALFDNGIKLWGEHIDSPSFLALSDDGKYMYTVTEANYSKIYSYEMSDDGAKKLDELEVPGTVLCHIQYSEKHKLLFGSCYGTGNVFAAEVRDGRFGRVFNYAQTVPGDSSEGITRAHCSVVNGDQLVTSNIALDRLYLYDIMADGLEERGFVQLRSGCGPRHLSLSRDKKRMYLITEYSNEIMVFDTKDYSILAAVSALPPGIGQKSTCSAVCLSPDERFLYGANRYTGTIVRFELENGIPHSPMWFRCGKNSASMYPRHMRMSGDFSLVIANKDSGEVVLYRLDRENGMPVQGEELVNFPSAADAVLLD